MANFILVRLKPVISAMESAVCTRTAVLSTVMHGKADNIIIIIKTST